MAIRQKTTMNIQPPPGYDEVAPLQKHHRVSLPAAGTAPHAFARLHAIPVSLEEFPAASRDYPLVFLRQPGSHNFSAVAALGMQPGQNLFMMSDGLWDRRVYLPAYVRRYPFCMAKPVQASSSPTQRLVCVETSALGGRGEALYDGKGDALPNWELLERLIADFENDLERSDELCKLLYELDLLEPFTMKADIDGFTLQLDGLHRVDQARLEALPEEHLRRLFDAGAMDKLYAHLLSLQNFRRILNRRSFFALKPPTDARELN
jgi:hypothetical protein